MFIRSKRRMLGAALLSLAAGVAITRADEPKTPTPRPTPKAGQTLVPPPAPGGATEIQQAQDQLLRAMQALVKDPNDLEARKSLDMARSALLKALGGGLPLPAGGFALGGFAPDGLPLDPGGFARDRVRLGVRLEPVAPLVSEQLGLEPGTGAAIAGVLTGSAAEKAGFKVHDIAIEFAGKSVSNPADLVRRVSEIKAGEKVDAVVLRRGKRVDLKGIELAAVNEAPPLPPAPPQLGKPQPGGRAGNSVAITVTNGEFTIDAVQEGVSYLISGKVGRNGATPEKVSVRSGDEKFEAASTDKIPEKYRPTLEKLLQMVGKPHPPVRD
jgi:membrane-associated protease RseP (regulator of RpoE activity)